MSDPYSGLSGYRLREGDQHSLARQQMTVPYAPPEIFLANTDRAWFDFLASRSEAGRVDEVNFWLPKATTPMRR